MTKGGAVMKAMVLFLVITLSFFGCATFQHSELIDTDQLDGNASGQYRNSSSGPSGNFTIAGAGVGVGGFGLGAISVTTGPPKISAYNFARSVAMINYSKKLKSIKYDETGGIIAYEFEQKPLPSSTSSYQTPGSKPNLPSSFGFQPIE